MPPVAWFEIADCKHSVDKSQEKLKLNNCTGFSVVFFGSQSVEMLFCPTAVDLKVSRI